MKKIFWILIWIGLWGLLFTIPLLAKMSTMIVGGGTTVAASGKSFSDDFNRGNSDSLGANWTEEVADIDILSNTLSFTTAGYEPMAAYYNTSTDTINQYTKTVPMYIGDGGYPSVALRYVDSSSAFYHVLINYSGDITVYKSANLAGFEGTSLATYNFTDYPPYTAPTSLGITITGTSTTTIRIWKDPTGDAPTSATSWGGDTSPDVTVNDSSSPYTTGKRIALIAFQGTAGYSAFDSFFGGDIP